MSVLDRIVDATRHDVAQRRREVPVAQLEQAIQGREDRPFSEALIGPRLSLIAEYKRRSPSAGLSARATGWARSSPRTSARAPRRCPC